MKNEFDWHIQINKMQNLNDMIGKQLECVDAALPIRAKRKFAAKSVKIPLLQQSAVTTSAQAGEWVVNTRKKAL